MNLIAVSRRVGTCATRWIALLSLSTVCAPAFAAQPVDASASRIEFNVARDYPASNVTPFGSAGEIEAADFDRDGTVDLVIANYGGGPVVLPGTGGGRFGARRVLTGPDPDAAVVSTADFNADGIPDIATGSYDTRSMTVFLGRGDGGFDVRGPFAMGVIPTQFAIADYNQDGRLDIASGAYYGGNVAIMLGGGDGTFRAGAPAVAANTSLALLTSDLNGDGIPDLAVAESGPQNAPGSLLPGELHVLIGKGDGRFETAVSYPVGLMPEFVQYGDVNEDGKNDLVVANALTNDVSFLYGLGGGRFDQEQRMRGGAPGSANIFDVHGDGNPGLQLADFNRDGHLDLAVVQTVSSRIALYQGDGRGNFAPTGAYDVAGFPEPLLAVDLNGDSCLDLAVPGNAPPVGPSDVGVTRTSILLNATQGCGAARAAAPSRPKTAKGKRCRPTSRGRPFVATFTRRQLRIRTRRRAAVRVTWIRRSGKRVPMRGLRRLSSCRTYRFTAPAGTRRVELRQGGRTWRIGAATK